MAAWQQASSVLAALVQALLPVEGPEGMPDEADEQRLGVPACVPAMHLTPASADPHLCSPRHGGVSEQDGRNIVRSTPGLSRAAAIVASGGVSTHLPRRGQICCLRTYGRDARYEAGRFLL